MTKPLIIDATNLTKTYTITDQEGNAITLTGREMVEKLFAQRSQEPDQKLQACRPNKYAIHIAKRPSAEWKEEDNKKIPLVILVEKDQKKEIYLLGKNEKDEIQSTKLTNNSIVQTIENWQDFEGTVTKNADKIDPKVFQEIRDKGAHFPPISRKYLLQLENQKVEIALSHSIIRNENNQWYISQDIIAKGTMGKVKNALVYDPSNNQISSQVVKVITHDFFKDFREKFEPGFNKEVMNEVDKTKLFFACSRLPTREVAGQNQHEIRRKDYIAQKKQPGQTLKNFLLEHPTLSSTEIINLFLTIAKKIAKIHEKGLVHCDMHDENILVTVIQTGNGIKFKIRIIDFQYATENGQVKFKGTHYRAPEESIQLARPKARTQQGEVFSVAVEMLKALSITEEKWLKAGFAQEQEVWPSTSYYFFYPTYKRIEKLFYGQKIFDKETLPHVKYLFQRMLAADKNRRPTMQEVVIALEELKLIDAIAKLPPKEKRSQNNKCQQLIDIKKELQQIQDDYEKHTPAAEEHLKKALLAKPIQKMQLIEKQIDTILRRGTIITSVDMMMVKQQVKETTFSLQRSEQFLEQKYPTSWLYRMTIGAILSLSQWFSGEKSVKNQLSSTLQKSEKITQTIKNHSFSSLATKLVDMGIGKLNKEQTTRWMKLLSRLQKGLERYFGKAVTEQEVAELWYPAVATLNKTQLKQFQHNLSSLSTKPEAKNIVAFSSMLQKATASSSQNAEKFIAKEITLPADTSERQTLSASINTLEKKVEKLAAVQIKQTTGLLPALDRLKTYYAKYYKLGDEIADFYGSCMAVLDEMATLLNQIPKAKKRLLGFFATESELVVNCRSALVDTRELIEKMSNLAPCQKNQ